MARVIIVGSGLSGMSAGISLSDAGHQVTVLESATHFGGRTASWDEKGMFIESGLHRFLGFYTALPDLISHVGVSLDDILCWEDEVEIRTVSGINATLGLAPIHKPLKTVWSAIGHHALIPPSDRPALIKMFASGIKEYQSKPRTLDSKTVASYARAHGISETTIEQMLTPLTEGIFFVPVTKYSMYNLLGLFMPYISSMYKLRVGAFMGGMSKVLIQPMVDYIHNKKGTVKLKQTVRSLIVKEGRVVGVIVNGQPQKADYVLLATSLYSAKEIIGNSFPAHPFFTDMMRLPTMPAVTFQIETRRPVMSLDRTTFGPNTIMASFAEQSRTTFRNSRGRLSVILANPEKYLTYEPSEILPLIQEDAGKLGISLKDEAIVDYRKVNLPYDFYSLQTGNDKLRPTQQTPVPGLSLAGDYTKQKYLATMEGAVVSGRLAAEQVVKELQSLH